MKLIYVEGRKKYRVYKNNHFVLPITFYCTILAHICNVLNMYVNLLAQKIVKLPF